MKIDITYKNKEEEIHIVGRGFLFFPFISFTNRPTQLLKSYIKLDKKLFGGGVIKEYYDTRRDVK